MHMGVCVCFGSGFGLRTGAPNAKREEKGLECSFPLSHIVLWSFKGIFVRANTI